VMARRKKSFSLSDWDYAPFHAAALQKMKPRKLVDALNAIVPFEQQPGVQEQLQLVIDRAETLRDIAEAAYRLGLAQQAGERARLREALKAKAEEWEVEAATCENRRGIENFKRDPQRFAILTRVARELRALLSAPAAAGSEPK
jgi:hypothetical protein